MRLRRWELRALSPTGMSTHMGWFFTYRGAERRQRYWARALYWNDGARESDGYTYYIRKI